MLTRGLRELDLRLTTTARVAIDGHVRLLLAWTAAINLTAIRDPAAVALLHVVDSLTGVRLVRSWGADSFLDLGSGGGYPGVPLAAALETDVGLAESTAKKAGFLRVVAAATGLGGRVSVEARRAEALAADPAWRGRTPVVTARAVASLPDLVELALPLLQIGGRLVAWKRGDLAGEIAAGQRALRALGGSGFELHPVRVSGLEDHVLVVAEKVRPTPDGIPRDPAVRRRRPW